VESFSQLFTRHGMRQARSWMSNLILLEVVSSVLILASLVWRGFEAQMSFDAYADGTAMPDYTRYVDLAIAVVFSLEVGARIVLLGSHFFHWPDVVLNLIDSVVVVLQALDASFQSFNFTFLRIFRVLRLFNAMRLLRSAGCVQEVRLLAAAVSHSMSSLFWVCMTVLASSYLFSTFVLHSIRNLVEDPSAPVDPALMKYYGTVGKCMLTLFKATTGGAPWEQLLQPLEDISWVFVVGFIVYLTFILYALYNIVTGIFVGKLTALTRRDTDKRMKYLVNMRGSSISKFARYLEKADTFGTGTVTEAQLEAQLEDPDFLMHLQDVGMEDWEARGVFDLLDVDSLGQIRTEDFLHAVVCMKVKERPLDLATVLHESRRVMDKMSVFMRFTEDHFRQIHELLGLPSRTQAMPGFEHYLHLSLEKSLRLPVGAADVMGISRGL